MKKIYMKPETISYKVELSALLGSSLPQTSAEEASTDGENYDKALSRGRGFWDDEEDF